MKSIKNFITSGIELVYLVTCIPIYLIRYEPLTIIVPFIVLLMLFSSIFGLGYYIGSK